ncbi:MAG TPA: imidazole glycerol phosphate synthase subunit HisH [Desulfobacteraceae bacterium]|nr:imidazole glycerol phosphate synthase subunit HisH [Desulfobacteraceae bacterium]HPJ66466.1 imidazole glycerol phosphate synthase subunit HisH [Desulfobacteraceae bacterium]HPQ27993.1 imidazole glycerol phosphate synthase subunit HisH [Desulfobacteraceae bacterium]
MISIIDYEAGNLKSVERALKKLGFACIITQNKEEINRSERIIFPGVGAAGKAIADLRRLGLDNVLIKAFEEGKPILGICLGAQIILEKSEENLTKCLGLIPGEVRLFPRPLFSSDKERLKIPHMGWNGIEIIKRHPVLNGVGPDDEFYFVHSYYVKPASDEYLIGVTEYGIEFCSIIGYRNLIAVQFHLEKSGSPGLRILKNFCKWDGTYNA